MLNFTYYLSISLIQLSNFLLKILHAVNYIHWFSCIKPLILIPRVLNPLQFWVKLPSRWLSAKEFACQCKRVMFNPWFEKIPWRRKWQSTLVFLPGKSHGQRSLAGYNSWGYKEVEITEGLSTHTHAHTHSISSWPQGQRVGVCLFFSFNYCPHIRVINILELDIFLENLRSMSRANLSCWARKMLGPQHLG